MTVIKWTFIREKNSKQEDQHMGSQKWCGWNRRTEHLSSLFLLAQSFQFYISIGTISFLFCFFQWRTYQDLPHRLVCLPCHYDSMIRVLQCLHAQAVCWQTQTWQLVSQRTTQNNIHSVTACDQLWWYPFNTAYSSGQAEWLKSVLCLWHALWPNCTDCRRLKCMALRGLPFGTMIIPHSVEVWQVVKEIK